MSTIVERIKEIISSLGITENRFAGEIGVNSQTLNNYTSEKRKVGMDVIDKILIKYPQISAEWLMRGVGDMLCCPASSTIEEDIFNGVQQNNITGDNNMHIGDAVLTKENEMLKQLLAEKEKQLEEKERMIQVLLNK